MKRRDVLRAGAGLVAAGGLAGCGALQSQSLEQPPLVENRPNAVYVPSHVEGMVMAGMQEAGDRMVGLFFSYAHRFWTVTGGEATLVDIDEDDTIHLMASVWDPETGTVLATDSGLGIEVRQDGERVDQRDPWAMLSQNMGFHFGDNITLPGDGLYDVTVETGGVSLDRRGEFEGRFGDSVSAEFELDYSSRRRDGISYTTLDDRKGSRGAVDRMSMDMPLSVAPAEGDLPGDVIGSGTSGDARLVVTRTPTDEGTYLAVSARTPYNRFVLPMMLLAVTVRRDGEIIADTDLTAAIDPERSTHYGTTVDSLQSGDEVTVDVVTAPTVSRHEGYETAFLDMDPVTVTVE